MNSHQFLGRAAVFDVGSKLTHTCGLPNTIYRTRGLDNGCGNHVALTAIQPHELLYTSYLG